MPSQSACTTTSTSSNRDSTARELFIRSLAAQTTTDTFRSVFSAFHNLHEDNAIFDKNTRKSMGYGFVMFTHVNCALLALKDPSKKIDSRMTVTQIAAAGGSSAAAATGSSAAAATDIAAQKVFVLNVPFEVLLEILLSHFLAYGEVEEGPQGFEKSSEKTKGFAFLV